MFDKILDTSLNLLSGFTKTAAFVKMAVFADIFEAMYLFVFTIFAITKSESDSPVSKTDVFI